MRTPALNHADLSITWDVLVLHALTNTSQNASLHIVIVIPISAQFGFNDKK